MKQTIISKAIKSGVITFDSLCHSWLARNGAGINPEILDAVLSANPKWLEQTISPANTYPRFEFISSDLYFKNINISDITLLGLSIAWNDTEAEAVIKKHLALHTITENPVAKIFGQNKLYINVNIRNLREILALLDEKKSYFKIREMFSKKFIELGVYLDGYYVTKLNLPERHWFTSEVTTRIMKIWEKPWFLREAIYPKEIPQCSLIKAKNQMLLYGNRDLFNLKADFFSAKKIIIQQQDGKFDLWCGEPFELTSLWPNQQLVIAVNHGGKKILGFAPIIPVHEPEKGTTEDNDEFNIFIEEFHTYYNQVAAIPYKRSALNEIYSIAQTSLSLCCWLKEHCAEKLDK